MNGDSILKGAKTTQLRIALDWLDTQLLGDTQENITVCVKNPAHIKHYKC